MMMSPAAMIAPVAAAIAAVDSQTWCHLVIA
jgi:hypothetical protein